MTSQTQPPAASDATAAAGKPLTAAARRALAEAEAFKPVGRWTVSGVSAR